MDFKSAVHLDKQNVPGSWSAVAVLTTGAAPFGGYYCLPGVWPPLSLDVKHGLFVLHKSAEGLLGLHANSHMAGNGVGSHRFSVVFYLTQKPKGLSKGGGVGGAADDEED
jgi:hypothetical protein